MTFCRIRTLAQDYYLLVEQGSIENGSVQHGSVERGSIDHGSADHGSVDDFKLALSDGTDVWHGSGEFPNPIPLLIIYLCSQDLVKLFLYNNLRSMTLMINSTHEIGSCYGICLFEQSLVSPLSD